LELSKEARIVNQRNKASKKPLTEKWLPPPMNMYQLNFYGTSKGNPGNSGFGGIFGDHKGAPILTFLGSRGWDTNNSMELEGLWQGLLLAQGKDLFPLIIEGDSQIIIKMVSRILQGPPLLQDQ